MTTQPVLVLELFNAQVQYMVPRWQRRYRWGKADIERLVEDLKTVAGKPIDNRHYTGTILTFPEPDQTPIVKRLRLVDGQQRLTTISILLATIAEALGSEGEIGPWTAETIRNDRLLNAGKPAKLRRKLRLQNRDEEEYRNELAHQEHGPGAVSAAFKICRGITAREDLKVLMDGIERMQVVQINLQEHDDPQQIYESLNGTGQPLSEGEKVKNWLLMGLAEDEQQELHDDVWKRTEKVLDAHDEPGRMDVFLRDLLRAQTGATFSKDRAYEELRRWAARTDRDADKPALLREIAEYADLYGLITGTADTSRLDRRVARELAHMRTTRIETLRPFVLRLLRDAYGTGAAEPATNTINELAKTLVAASTWITRLWLSGKATAGFNTVGAMLAAHQGPEPGEEPSTFWTNQIKELRHTRTGVPTDDEVRDGVHNRKAYGGQANNSTLAILYALIRAEQGEESPPLQRLTIEHVMPQKLNDAWRDDLGPDAASIHGQYRDKLGNLTLSGDRMNPAMGNGPFHEKRADYSKSPILMNRRIADADAWSETEIEGRSEDLANRILARWPWDDPAAAARPNRRLSQAAEYRWKLADGAEHVDVGTSQFTLHVTAALLDLDPENVKRLSGSAVTADIHPASRYPAGQKAGAITMLAIPRHPDWVMNAYRSQENAVQHCRRFAVRCGTTLHVQLRSEPAPHERFWTAFQRTGRLLAGSHPSPARSRLTRTGPHNARGDTIAITVDPDEIRLAIESAGSEAPDAARPWIVAVNRQIAAEMSDQRRKLPDDATLARPTAIYTPIDLDGEDEWAETAEWLATQHDRLVDILSSVNPDLVVTPNEWSKPIVGKRGTSERKEKYRRFFQALIDTLREEHDFTGARKAQRQNWYSFSSGTSWITYGANFTAAGRARVDLYIDSPDLERTKLAFKKLEQQRAVLESELGALTWDRSENRRAIRISTLRPGSIDDNQETLEEVTQWMIDSLLAFKRVFGPRLATLAT